MKFTVLLPTRNRLDLLKYAVSTVLRQNFHNWEIIVSDNVSEENVKGYIESLNDDRIKYFKTDQFIPVTDNWNNALKRATGDYVIMLGDDDGLLKGYFNKINELVEKFHSPDFIYTNALLYTYPEVLPAFPQGSLQDYRHIELFKSKPAPYFIEKQAAYLLVKQSMNFRVRFGFNMQFAVINRRFIASLKDKGEFFKTPYPDYYAMNVMFLTGARILIYPLPLVVIGISQKSFGSYYFNNKEAEGVEFLKNDLDQKMNEGLKDILMPGTNMNSSWLVAMETIKTNFRDEFNLNVNYRRYRLLQSISLLNSKELKTLKILWNALQWKERLIGMLISPIYLILMLLPKRPRIQLGDFLNRFISPFPSYHPKRCKFVFNDILEVFEKSPSPDDFI